MSSYILRRDANILESQQFGHRPDHRFFMRVHFEMPSARPGLQSMRQNFDAIADRFSMRWRLVEATAPTRTLVLASKFGHCVNDLLFRSRSTNFRIDVAGIVPNHRDLEQLADSYEIPFHHIPITPATRPEAEAELLQLVDESAVDLIVLARYMQILSPDLCKRLEGRVINIHHSFLPSFKGAKPYHQAHERGVKLIGATAHYITPDLDEGPIIEQAVARVDHAYTADELVTAGRDIESQVLARAVRWHSEHRVLLNRARTVVFR